MKSRILLVALFLGIYIANAQNTYDKLWKEVESLELEGKFKSANDVVDIIINKAKRSHQSQLIVKGFIYKSKFTLLLEEESETKIISELETLIGESDFPTKALLESVYASYLQQYMQKNRFKMRQRTKDEFPSKSVNYTEWDINTLTSQIAQHYDQSLIEPERLKKLSINDFQLILTNSKTSHKFRPTLYDFLAHRALEFYAMNKWGVSRPKDRFYINNTAVFSTTEQFIQEPFYTSDSIFSNRNALKLFQQLEAFHETLDTIAYVDIVLERLKFARANTSFKNKDEFYLKALNQLSERFNNHEASSTIEYQIANFYFESSNHSNAKNDLILKDYRIRALAICNTVLKKSPNSDGGLLCTILKNNIEEPTITIEIEKYIIPEKPFLAKVTFKGVDSLYMNVYQVPYNFPENKYSYKKDSLVLELIKKNKPIRSGFYKLQHKKNYYKYSTEIDLPSLKIGNYLIVATKEKEITSIDQFYNYQIVKVSSMSMLNIQKDKSLMIKVLDRQNGIPITDVRLSVTNDDDFNQSGITDEKGEFHIKKGKDYHQNLRIIATHQNDTLLSDNYYLPRNSNKEVVNDEHNAEMFLYLDRSIYRPGQTVYFKGILIENNKQKSRVVPNTYTSVIIYDANDEEIKEFRLKTNEYGSVSGEFKIPSNVLTGEFYIEMDEDYGTDDEDEDGYYEKIDNIKTAEVYFSVEEYKRPKFEVIFDTISENYKLGDSIKVSGIAKAYFGSAISGAQVNFSITRESRSNWRQNYYGSPSQIINTGTTKTDAKGAFTVSFVAFPDSLSSKANKPIFLYTVKADITDINGETRSESKTVKIGFHNLKVDVLLADKLNRSISQQFKIETKNLNDQAIEAEVELNIYKLSSPERVLRKKPWEIVEFPSIPKDTFIELFPNEAYDSTDIKEHWEKGTLVFSEIIDASKLKLITLNNILNWESGSYLAEVKAIDVFKDTVSENKHFEVYHPDDKFLSDKQLFEYEIVNSDFKNDKSVSIKLKTACEILHVNLEAYYKGELVFNELITIKNGSALVNVPVAKYYKNKLDFNVYFAKFNSLYSDRFSANLLEIDQHLSIETLSFRNRLVPNQKETWSFKITNSNNQNAEAEVLASMYDTSLDQFKKHFWNTKMGFDNYHYSHAPWVQGGDFFGTTIFRNLKYPKQNNALYFIKNYHKLQWFGFNFGNPNYVNKAYLSGLSAKKNNPHYIEGNINGIIISDDDGSTLPGVSVVVKGTSIGTTTDMDGFYSINAPIDSELVFSFIGMESQNIVVKKSGTINVAMTSSSLALDEVIVTAYGIVSDAVYVEYEASDSDAKDFSIDIKRKLAGNVTGLSITESNVQPGSSAQITIRGASSISGNNQTLFIIDGVPMDSNTVQLSPNEIADISVLKGEAAIALYGARAKNGAIIITTKKGLEALTQIETRDDLKETAFFFPHLKTNENGELIFSFDSPQALTKWRLMLFAHNKTLEVGELQKMAITQKDLNVIPNAPRFLREGDTIILSTKISNLTKKTLSGMVALQLFDAVTMKPIGNDLIPMESIQNFSLSSSGNTSVAWELKIPEGIQAIQYKIVAKSGAHSDGETSVLPVLSNRILVTEARPLWVPAGKSQEVLIEKLAHPISTTQKNHKFTLEYTSNPAWLAIKSLPYLMEFPYECAEQTFSRYYANALAEDIISKNKEIEAVFKSWVINDSIKSLLEKNEVLKSILISESPWVRDLQSDKENKLRLANLFEKEKVRDQQLLTLSKLKELQLASGGFPWFAGGKENTFITRHIVAGLGHLQKLNVTSENDYKTKPILKNAIAYLDTEFVSHYYKSIQLSRDSSKISLSNNTIHYLYSRSFFLDSHPLSDKTKKIFGVYLDQCATSWLTQSTYNKGMIALVLNRNGDFETAKKIIEALNEQAVHSEENGMYWKENSNSWYWYKSPIETQALLIEAFTEIDGDTKKVEQLKQWLIRNKQTNKWGSTKATTEAIYALLMHGNSFLSVSDNTIITIGNEKIKTSKLDETRKEAGTGYLKVDWKEQEINSKMASVKVENKSQSPGFGGVYWQYFEDIDKIQSSEKTPLSIKKTMFVKRTSDNGEVLIPITTNTPILLGDLVTVRIEIISKNDMEFVHLKDLRASGLEPIDVLSEYKWQDGLGYYQSTKDVATHFFFDELPVGTYIFEYDLRANNSGNFSNGISTIQSMYAPEFMSNSEGIRLKIDWKE